MQKNHALRQNKDLINHSGHPKLQADKCTFTRALFLMLRLLENLQRGTATGSSTRLVETIHRRTAVRSGTRVGTASNELDASLALFLDTGSALTSFLKRHWGWIGLEPFAQGSYLIFGDDAHVDFRLSQRAGLLACLGVRGECRELPISQNKFLEVSERGRYLLGVAFAYESWGRLAGESQWELGPRIERDMKSSGSVCRGGTGLLCVVIHLDQILRGRGYPEVFAAVDKIYVGKERE
ncbi:hypothetical protein BGZ57DRAFT_912667 [Hyaloscypha finlandica]|nr:hypothetical protein BGZ57DRAFT_912667 [Hyaloscypha finlandica]